MTPNFKTLRSRYKLTTRSAGLYHSTSIKYTIHRRWSWLSLKSSTMFDWNPPANNSFRIQEAAELLQKTVQTFCSLCPSLAPQFRQLG